MEERKTELQQRVDHIRDSLKDTFRSDREEQNLKDLRKRLVVSLLFVVPLFVTAMTTRGELWSIALQIALLIPIVIINHRCFVDGFTSIYSKKPEKNTLAAIGSVAAILTMQLATAGIVLSTMAVCRYCEAYINSRLDEHLKRLIEAEPEDPDLPEGTVLTVLKGGIIPADGIVLSGVSAVNEELITGDQVPMTKKTGDVVYAGTKNLSEDIDIRVSACGEETTISKIIDHISSCIATSPPIAERAQRAARVMVLVVLGVAVLTALFWGGTDYKVIDCVIAAVAVLVVANPYAFSAGVPITVLGAVVRGAGEGMLIRSADILELARDINVIAMNKTGTVTAGRPEISDVVIIEGGFSLRLAGALEREAAHPIGKAIYAAACEQYGDIPAVENAENVKGRGIRGTIGGTAYIAGNSAFMHENGISVGIPGAESLYRQGKNIVFFADKNRVIGLIALRDGPKPVSMKAISRIEGMGIDVVMLTGESRETSEAIRSEVGLDRIFSEILPEEKAEVIHHLKGENGDFLTAMVGNGTDDAAAIEAADMGIEIGRGKDLHIGSADIILISNDLMDVVRAINLSRKSMRYIRQNIAFAYCYNILAVLAAAAVLVPFAGPLLSPMIAALCMCASQALIVVGILRIKSARL